MKIAVIDVAADSSGALSVLNDFVDSLIKYENNSKNEWYIFTSIVSVKESNNVHNIRCPYIKKSWLHRLAWERNELKKYIRSLNIDVIFSLQNNGLPVKKIPQIVFFHNVLLVQNDVSFSLWKKEERKFFLYNRILAPYIRKSWKYVDSIIVQGNSVRDMVCKYFDKNIYIYRPNVTENQTNEKTNKIKGYIYPTSPAKYKNLELLIKAIRMIQDSGKEIRLLLTIKGDENRYASRIKALSKGINGIEWLGHVKREELFTKYLEYGLVMPSLLESFSVPILEAMNSGTVIVAIDRPYVLDAWEETHYNRMYITKACVEDLKDSLLKGLEDEQIGDYMQTEANVYERIIENVLKIKSSKE